MGKGLDHMLRIHNTHKRIPALRRYTRQQAARKPAGLWWGLDTNWLDHIDGGKVRRRQNGPHNYLVAPEASNLLVLKDWQDILDFTIRYGSLVEHAGPQAQSAFSAAKEVSEPHSLGELGFAIRVPAIDWNKVAQDHDGIEITGYQRAGRPFLEWLHTDWDVASGCIWRTQGTKVRGPCSLQAVRAMVAQRQQALSQDGMARETHEDAASPRP